MSSTTTSTTGPTPDKKIKKSYEKLNDQKVIFDQRPVFVSKKSFKI